MGVGEREEAHRNREKKRGYVRNKLDTSPCGGQQTTTKNKNKQTKTHLTFQVIHEEPTIVEICHDFMTSYGVPWMQSSSPPEYSPIIQSYPRFPLLASDLFCAIDFEGRDPRSTVSYVL